MKYIVFLMLLIPGVVDANQDHSVGRLFQENCMSCHGVYGNGKGVLSEFLTPKPRDFTSYKDMSHLTGDSEVIEGIIRNGSAGTAMPAFGGVEYEGEKLTDAQIASLARYVQSFLADEQYLLQLCVMTTFNFDTHMEGGYTLEKSGDDLTIMSNGSYIKIRPTNPARLAIKMLKKKSRATRTTFKVVKDGVVPFFMVVRFNSPCPSYLKDKGGHKLTRLF